MVLVPDATVTIADSPPAAAALTDTGTGFMVGLFERGASAGAVRPADYVSSLGQLKARHGAQQAYNANEYAAAEGFFAEGGTRLYLSRIVGPTAVNASAAVPAAGSKFTATAKGPGAGYNTIKVSVASTVITVKDGSTVMEVSPPLASIADAQTWAAQFSDLIDITPLTTGALADSPDVTLAGGDDDRTNVSDTERQTAIDRFGADLGPGQVFAPGDGRAQMHQILAQHALDTNRFALCDPTDTATAVTITSLATTARSLGRDLARHMQILGDWLVIPGLAPGTTRVVPPSGVHAGLCARNDANTHPNTAIAGPASGSRTAIGVHYTRSEDDLQAFAEAGVTPYRVDGSVQPYDDITPVDSSVDPEWWAASSNRMVMRIVQDAKAIAKSFMFNPISGSVDYIGYKGALEGMLSRWRIAGALYGDNPADAYRVETGSSVNTPETIQAKKLRAAMSLHLAQNVRNADVTITNTPITEAL